jgi:hypothetical protein
MGSLFVDTTRAVSYRLPHTVLSCNRRQAIVFDCRYGHIIDGRLLYLGVDGIGVLGRKDQKMHS